MTAFNPYAWQRERFALTVINQGLVSAKPNSVKKYKQPRTGIAANSTISYRIPHWQHPKAQKCRSIHPVKKAQQKLPYRD